MSQVHHSAVDELPLFAPLPIRVHSRPFAGHSDPAAARDRALHEVEKNADQEWLRRAEIALETYLRTHPEFFVDDFWEATALPAPRESRALGPVVLKASRLGWMQKTGRSRPSVRSHLSDKPIWKSLIFLPANHANGRE